jgi:hypothetical protein
MTMLDELCLCVSVVNTFRLCSDARSSNEHEHGEETFGLLKTSA